MSTSSNNGAFPSVLATAANFAIFVSICVVARQWHGWKQFQSAIAAPDDKDEDKRRKLVVVSGCDCGLGRLLVENLFNTTDYLVLALVITVKGFEELKAVAHVATDEKSNERLFVQHCNVTSEENIHDAKARVNDIIEARSAVLYSVVNNAGIANPGDFLVFENVYVFQRIMDVNFFGQLRLTQALLPIMLRTSKSIAGGARILNLSSVCGSSATPSNSAYNASKFAVEAWSDSLRLELEDFNIKVVKIRPGRVSTSIQHDFKVNMIRNFNAAPVQIRELYGGDAYSEKMKNMYSSMESSRIGSPSDPSLVVDTLTELLAMEGRKLDVYYWIGNDAHTLWRALHSLPTSVADSVKRILQIHPIQPDVPPLNVISHVTITVKNIDKSVPFYQAFGLEIIGETKNGYQFLRSHPSKTGWPTHVLLKEDNIMPSRGKASNAGMTRLCLYAPNLEVEVSRLEKVYGLKTMAPRAYGKSGACIAAYQDPDGFVIYLLRFPVKYDLILRAFFWWRKAKTPRLFHWTVNVSDVKASITVFDKLGFVKVFDGSGDKVQYDMVPAFNIKQEGCFIEYFRVCGLPNDALMATIVGWISPESKVMADSLLNTLTISVRDVAAALDKAQAAGMETEPAKYVDLPVFGKVHIGTAYVEPGANRIEFCCFTNKLDL